jgi:hypothetical protein
VSFIRRKTDRKGRTYLYEVESYRDPQTGKNRHRVLQYIGRDPQQRPSLASVSNVYTVGDRVWFRYFNQVKAGEVIQIKPALIEIAHWDKQFGICDRWQVFVSRSAVLGPILPAGTRVHIKQPWGWVKAVVIDGFTQVPACSWPRQTRADIEILEAYYPLPGTVTVRWEKSSRHRHCDGRTILPVDCVHVGIDRHLKTETRQ